MLLATRVTRAKTMYSVPKLQYATVVGSTDDARFC